MDYKKADTVKLATYTQACSSVVGNLNDTMGQLTEVEKAYPGISPELLNKIRKRITQHMSSYNMRVLDMEKVLDNRMKQELGLVKSPTEVRKMINSFSEEVNREITVYNEAKEKALEEEKAKLKAKEASEDVAQMDVVAEKVVAKKAPAKKKAKAKS